MLSHVSSCRTVVPCDEAKIREITCLLSATCLGCAVTPSKLGSDGGGLSIGYHAGVSYGAPARTLMWVFINMPTPRQTRPISAINCHPWHPVILHSGLKPHNPHRRGIVPWTGRGKMILMIMSLSFFWVHLGPFKRRLQCNDIAYQKLDSKVLSVHKPTRSSPQLVAIASSTS
jgi:hypothetical protein